MDSGEVLSQEPEQPVRCQYGSPGLVLGWASVQPPVVQLVELPLDPDPARPDISGFQAHQLAPSDAGEALGHHRHELVIAARQQGRPLGDQDDPERGSDRLLGTAMLRPASTFSAAAALGRRVPGDEPVLHGVGQDEMQQRPPRADARVGVPGRPFPPFPHRDSCTARSWTNRPPRRWRCWR
jgi:hypothetical protein